MQNGVERKLYHRCVNELQRLGGADRSGESFDKALVILADFIEHWVSSQDS